MLVSQFLDGGGSERQMRQLAAALPFAVHVAFLRPNEDRERELQAAGIKTCYVPLRSYMSTDPLTAALRLQQYWYANGIRLVHTFDAPSTTFFVPVARLAGIPVVLASQRGNRRLDPKITQRLRRFTDPFAHGVVVNAPALRDHLVRDAGIARDKIRFCPNGLDTTRFTAEGRVRLPELAAASVVVGCVAAHRPEKQLPFLVDGFADIARQRPGVKLVLVGSGSETPHILERIATHQLGAQCVIIPHTADTAPILRSIDIFQLTSVSEGQSNSLMEAMACGCAVVASDVEGTRDLVRDGVNGFLFAYGNRQDLVAKTRTLVDDAELRGSIAKDASQWVRSTMSVEASAARMAEIYQEFLGLAKTS